MSKLKIIEGGKMLININDKDHPKEIEKINVLLNDAFQTHQKCGRLPSELLEENQELREALQTLIRVTKNYKVGINNDILYRVENKTYKMSEKALTKKK